jgi:hypothetical protein
MELDDMDDVASLTSLAGFVGKYTKVVDNGDVDVHFFQVKIRGTPDVNNFIALIDAHVGDFNEVDVFDGNEHGYMELGGWIGDQGYALRFMALGSYLKLWDLMTPENMLGAIMPDLPKELLDELAGKGMITIKAQ